jgi:hypothetical protein
MAGSLRALDCIKFSYPETYDKYKTRVERKQGVPEFHPLRARAAGATAKEREEAMGGKSLPKSLGRSESSPPSVISVASSSSAKNRDRKAAQPFPDGWSVPRTPSASEVSRIHIPGQFGPRLKPKGLEHDIYSLYEVEHQQGGWKEPPFRPDSDPKITMYAPKTRAESSAHTIVSSYGQNFTHGNFKAKNSPFTERLKPSQLPHIEELQKEWEEHFEKRARMNPRSISKHGFKRNPQGNQYEFCCSGMLS